MYKLSEKVTLRQAWGGGSDLPGHVCAVNADGTYSVWAGRQVVFSVPEAMLEPR